MALMSFKVHLVGEIFNASLVLIWLQWSISNLDTVVFACECLEDGRVYILGYKCERYGNMHLESLAQHGNVSGTGLAVQVGEKVPRA